MKCHLSFTTKVNRNKREARELERCRFVFVRMTIAIRFSIGEEYAVNCGVKAFTNIYSDH